MNWFERYGIPGAYFVSLMAIWIYAIRPDLFKNEACLSPELLAALAALIFLPSGYVISIIGQSVYLNWRSCFIRLRFGRLRGCLGFHGAALDSLDPANQYRDEAIIEARTLLLTASRNGPLSVNTHRYMRDWIAKRMDVVAINLSLLLATFLAFIITLILLSFARGLSLTAIIPFIISILVIIAMVYSIVVLRRQVIRVIAGIYRTYR